MNTKLDPGHYKGTMKVMALKFDSLVLNKFMSVPDSLYSQKMGNKIKNIGSDISLTENGNTSFEIPSRIHIIRGQEACYSRPLIYL